MILKNVIPNASAVLLKKSAYLQAGGASTDFSYYGDWLMWIKILTLGKISYSQHRYNYFRRHEQSFVAKESSNIDQFVATKEINFRIGLLSFLNKLQEKEYVRINKEKLEGKTMLATRYLWFNKNKIEALKYYLVYLRYSPNLKASISRSLKSFFKK